MYVIQVLERIKYNIQHVGKAETEFNIRLNNYRKNVWKPDDIHASRHFSRKSHEKFILFEQIRQIDIEKEKIGKG